MERKNIALIGMAGVGKSSVGESLAKSLGYAFVDTDKQMENERGKSLQKILDEVGEEKFLTIEATAVRSALNAENIVLAPGGSIVYSKDAVALLKKASIIIYLSARAETIEKRIDTASRGIIGLKGKSFVELYAEIKILYEKAADIVINGEEKSPREIAEEILEKIITKIK